VDQVTNKNKTENIKNWPLKQPDTLDQVINDLCNALDAISDALKNDRRSCELCSTIEISKIFKIKTQRYKSIYYIIMNYIN